MQKKILDAFLFRHAAKDFDVARIIPEPVFATILQAGRLSPSSFGFEPWRFLVVQDAALRAKLHAFTWGGQKQIPNCSHLVVYLARKGMDCRLYHMILQSHSEKTKIPKDTCAQRPLQHYFQ